MKSTHEAKGTRRGASGLGALVPTIVLAAPAVDTQQVSAPRPIHAVPFPDTRRPILQRLGIGVKHVTRLSLLSSHGQGSADYAQCTRYETTRPNEKIQCRDD